MKKTIRLSAADYFVTGSISYMIADIIHECLGHGGMCLLLGNKITLLNSVYFRSSPGNHLTDIGGPCANLVAGILIYILLKNMRHLPFLLKWLMLNTMAYSLCWFSGTILESIVNDNGDWSYAAKDLNLNIHITHWLLLLVSVLSYIVFFRMIGSFLKQESGESPYSKKQLLLYPFLFAILTASVAGLFFPGDRINTAFGGALEMVSSIPILFIRFKSSASPDATTQTFRYPYLIGVSILFILFCFTFGQGIHP